MKNINLLKYIIGASLIFLFSCENQPWHFPDNEFTSSYFPFQSPMRTLILGEYDLADNSNDNLLKFNIGVRVGGMYNNTKEWSVNYVLDSMLTKNLFDASNDTMRILPSKYYSINPKNSIQVPIGSFVGNVEVQLNSSFLDDPLSYKGVYVLPLRITSSTTDSILTGKLKSSIRKDSADIRLLNHWDYPALHYTLYGIKFINAYHGVYLRRGVDSIRELNTNILKLPIVHYRQSDVVKDELCNMKTAGRNTVELSSTSRPAPLNVKMLFEFSTAGISKIINSSGNSFDVSGNAKFVKNGDAWGGKNRNVIYASYKITDVAKNEIHYVRDTLVVRDRDVKFETFTVVVNK